MVARAVAPMYSSSQVDELLRALPNPNDAKRLRELGKLLVIWDGEERRYPAWQFIDGVLDGRVAELLALLPPQGEDKTGWRRALWLTFPNELLKDGTPTELWRHHPDAVIEAAREEFGR